MITQLNTISLNDFVKLADVIFTKMKETFPVAARTSGIFRELPIPANSGESREVTEIDLNLFAAYKAEGDPASRAKVQQGYSKTMYVKRVGRDLPVTYEMRRYNKYPEVLSVLTNLSNQPVQRMELDLTHRLTFGPSTSYTDMDGRAVTITTGDGLALFSTAHLLKGSATTYRNILANNPKFSRGALEGMERLITEQTFNHLGEKVPMAFDIIFSSDDPNTVNAIREFLQSSASVEPGANSGVMNVYRGKYRHVVLPYLATDATGAPDTTKRYYWGLVSSRFFSAFLGVWDEPYLIPPQMGDANVVVDREDWVFGSRSAYAVEILSGLGIKVSKGNGEA